MSSQSVALNNGQQAIINNETQKVVGWGLRTEKFPYNNAGYDDDTLLAGTVMGRVDGTQYVIPLVTTANDGSQRPVGILVNDNIVEGGDTRDLLLAIKGDINESALVLPHTNDIDATISGEGRLRDILNRMGLIIRSTTENSAYDNQ